MGYRIEEEFITPEKAAAFLGENDGNRSVKKGLVKYFCGMMIRSEWRSDTAEPIKIGKDGKLLDGQHRLHAVLSYGKPVRMAIIYGLENDIKNIIDTGSKRSGADICTMQGCKNAKTVAGAARLIINFKNDNLTSFSSVYNKDVEKLIKVNAVLNDHVAQCVSLHGKSSCKVSPSIMSFILNMAYHDNKEQMGLEFVEGVYKGESLRNDSPVYVLREKLLRVQKSNKEIKGKHLLALIIKAWNLHSHGESTKKLSYDNKRERGFPKFDIAKPKF